MKLGPEIWSLLHLTVFILGIQFTVVQGGKDRGSNYGDYNTYNNYNYGGQSAYSNYDGQDDIPESLCYSCTYHLRQGHAQGFDNCRDPFIPFGIHEQSCKGSCSKIYTKTSDTEYTISRMCMPNCMNLQDDAGYTECCTGRLCNGAKDSAGHKGQWAMMVSVIATLWALR